ncbi:MAG: MORN repeat-containing protein [Bacteroidia bacterium]
MTRPAQPFDSNTLRDAHVKERFETLLKQAQALREHGAYVDLAVRHDVLNELDVLYEENLERYQTHYVENKEAWRVFRHSLATNKHNIAQDDYQHLLEKLESAEALLQVFDYDQNAQAKPIIEEAEALLQAALSNYKHRDQALETHRQALKIAMERVWAEDYVPLKSRYQLLKASNSATDIAIDQERVNMLAEKRNAHIEEALLVFGKKKKHAAAIEKFRSGYAHKADFDNALKLMRNARRNKRMLLVGLLILVLASTAFALWKVPPMLEGQAEEDAYNRAINLDTWQSYDAFLDKYPEGAFRAKALERQNLLDYGALEQAVISSGDTVRYEGALNAGVPDGVGKAVFTTGRVYEGSWRAGHMEGQGTLTYPDGGEFVGEFDNNEQKSGIRRLANGTEFSGIWKNGALTGEGSARWADGTRYSGNWRGGKFHGFGTLKAGRNVSDIVKGAGWASGASYSGAWRNSLRQGTGKFSYADGRIYEGAWSNDMPDGKPGTMKWPDGSRFRGIWKQGKIEGDGTYVDRFGNDFSGYWRGTPAAIERRIKSTGKVETGRFQNGKYEYH